MPITSFTKKAVRIFALVWSNLNERDACLLLKVRCCVAAKKRVRSGLLLRKKCHGEATAVLTLTLQSSPSISTFRRNSLLTTNKHAP
jgi:hypothetical protein